MRLKQNVLMFLVLSGLLASVCLGIYFAYEPANNEIIIDEPEVVEEFIVPETYTRNIINKEDVPKEILDVVNEYFNRYFKSIYSLQLIETKDLFEYSIDGAMSDAADKLLIESRKKYDYDFRMSDAKYDLTIVDYYEDDDAYYLSLLEDDYYNFMFLDGITSEVLGIECDFVFSKIDGQYKIYDLNKSQDFYLMFYENRPDELSGVDKLYDYYFESLSKSIENELYLKQVAENSEYIEPKTYDIKYDRDAAVAYANKYYSIRNSDWYDFSDEGGNCQNYASQAMYYGQIIMDYDGIDQWKCYIEDPEFDPLINEYEEPSGRTGSWVNVPYFYEYAKENTGMGLVADTDANIYFAQPGDIIQVGVSSYVHTTIVSRIVDGHILLNSNSNDMKDFPLTAYAYPKRRLIKILGSNY